VKRGMSQPPERHRPSPALQAVLSAAFGVEQTPVLMLHVPAVWQVAGVPHTTGFDPTQAPLWQLSVFVQALPSEQAVPFAALVCAEQVPVAGLQVPTTLHAAAVGQTTGLEPTQAPFWHESVWVHMSPSEHDVPFAAFVGVEQRPVD